MTLKLICLGRAHLFFFYSKERLNYVRRPRGFLFFGRERVSITHNFWQSTRTHILWRYVDNNSEIGTDARWLPSEKDLFPVIFFFLALEILSSIMIANATNKKKSKYHWHSFKDVQKTFAVTIQLPFFVQVQSPPALSSKYFCPINSSLFIFAF